MAYYKSNTNPNDIVEVGDAGLNPSLVANRTQVSSLNPSSAIAVDSLGKAISPPAYTPPQDTTNYGAITAGSVPPPAPATPSVDGATSTDGVYTKAYKDAVAYIKKLAGMDTGKTAYTQEQLNTSGATALEARQKEITGQITSLNNEATAIPIQAQKDAEGRGITSAGLSPITTGQLRNNAIRALSLKSEYDLNSGQLESAKITAQRAVDLKYKDIETEIDNNTKLLALYAPFMTEEQKIKADAVTKANDEKKTAIADKKKQQTDVINAAQEAAKNGLPGASQLASDALKLDPNSSTFTQDLAALQAKVPISTLDQQIKEAQLNNIKSEIAKRSSDAEIARNTLPSSVQTRVQGVAGQFDGEQAVKSYQIIAETIDAVKNAGISPTDDIQRIYAVAKVFDPNSAVREGEYKTVQDYATSLLQRVGLKANRVFNNDGFLTDEARKFINTSLENRLSSSKKAYDNIYNSYGDRINKVTGKSDGKDYITDYSAAFKNTTTIPSAAYSASDPTGKVWTFPDQTALDAFKKAANIK